MTNELKLGEGNLPTKLIGLDLGGNPGPQNYDLTDFRFVEILVKR